MSSGDFTAGYLTGAKHRTVTDADREAEGDWTADDAYLRCPAGHAEQTVDCDWCAGFAAAWE